MSDKLCKLFKSFIDDIIKVFPEYEKSLKDYYCEIYNSEEKEYLRVKSFLKNINEISDKIVDKDITLFEDDPIILQNVSFKLMWNSNISDETKNTIWKYLQTFCIINIKSESTDEKINEVIKSIESNEKVKDKQTVKNMKKLKKLNENFDIKGIKKVIDENPSSVDNGMGEIDSMFQNTSIGKIAKEVTEDLNIGEIMSGGGGIEDLFSGGNMANIMQTISSKISDNGNLNPDDLMKEASSICGSMEGNPLFTSLMGMQKNMMGEMPQTSGETKNINLKSGTDNEHNPNKTKERLQKKLKEKKNVTVEKIN